MIGWLFRNRKTGEITIWQRPNLPIAVFVLAALIRRFASLEGGAQDAVGVIATASLVWWAGDELIRGVNPFRRLLGGGVLLATIGGLIVSR